MTKKGWSPEEVLKLKAEGYCYSPGRDTLLGPVMSSGDIENIDEVDVDTYGGPLRRAAKRGVQWDNDSRWPELSVV